MPGCAHPHAADSIFFENQYRCLNSASVAYPSKIFSLDKLTLKCYNIKITAIYRPIMLPISSPAQAVNISPEGLEVANAYLGCQSLQKVSDDLGYPPDQVAEILSRPEIKAYINSVFADMGFNNRFRLRQVMDLLISKKLEELDEAEVGSSKDIADLLALSHKMSMDIMDREIQLEKLKQSNKVQTQVNVQMNEFGGDGSKYSNLISKLLAPKS